MRKKENILTPYGLYAEAFLKLNLTIAEKLLDKPVLISGLCCPVNMVPDGTRYFLPFSLYMAA
jgi:hypothetical protein